MVAPDARLARVEVSPLENDSAQVVRLCMNGDSGAWAELVRTHHRRVYGLCYRFTGNPADAEDMTQDVFLKIYSNLASFDLTRGSRAGRRYYDQITLFKSVGTALEDLAAAKLVVDSLRN